jgi:hypothetical protein
MSLLNQMLKDLEQRRPQDNKTDKVATDSLKPVTEKKAPKYSRLRVVVWAVVAVVVLLVLWWMLGPSTPTPTRKPGYPMLRQHIQRSVKQVVNSPAPKSVATPAETSTPDQQEPSTPPVPLVSNLLKELSVSRSGDQTIVTVSMADPIHDQVVPDKAIPQVLKVLIEGRMLPQSMPSLTNDPLLAKIEADSDNQQIHLFITMKPTARLVGSTVDPTHPTQLVLTFSPIPVPAVSTEVPVVPIAQPIPLTPMQQAQQAYQVVLSEYQSGQVAQAFQDLALVVNQFPNYMPARITLIKNALSNGQYTTAKGLLAEGLRQSPHDPALLTLMAQSLYLQGHTQDALAFLQQDSPKMGDYTDYYTLQAALLLKLGKNNAASDLYSQLLMIDSSQANWWLGLGLALEAEGQSSSAISAYQHVLNNPSITPDVRMFVMAKLRQLGG